MRHPQRFVLAILAGLVFPRLLLAAPIEIRDNSTDLRISGTEHLLTPRNLTVESLLQAPFAATNKPQLPLAEGRALWLRAQLINLGRTEFRLAMRYEFPWTDRVDFFLFNQAGTLEQHAIGGDRVPGRRENPVPVIHFTAKPLQTITLLVRIETPVRASAQLHLLSAERYEKYLFAEYAVQGIFSGVVLMLLLFHLNLFVATRDKTIARYLAYLAVIGIFIPLRSGVLPAYLLGDYAHLGDSVWTFLVSAAYLTGLRFARTFLSLSTRMPVTDKLLGYLQLICIAPVLALVFGRSEAYVVENIVGILAGPPVLLLGIYCAFRRHKQSLYFVLCYSLPIAAAITDNLVENGALPVFAGRNEMLPVAIAAEFLLFAIVLYSKLSDIEVQRVLDKERLSRLDGELAFARMVQQSLLPAPELTVGNVRIEAISTTQNAVGGDYFDVVQHDNGEVHLLLIDAGAAGKSTFLTAALDASAARMAFRNSLAESAGMESVLRRMFALLSPALGTRQIALTYCIIQPTNGKCRLCVMDNPPAVHVSAAARRSLVTAPTTDEGKHEPVWVNLAANEFLCLPTRGLQKRVNLLRDRLSPFGRIKALRVETTPEDRARRHKSFAANPVRRGRKDMTLIAIYFAGAPQ